MEHPVYPFRAVLRELRRDAGLTILAAAEATGYGKYERWESGQTNVGGQYLRSIAEAFAITDELHLLLYALVLDQLTPDGGSARRLDLDELRRRVRLAPPGDEADELVARRARDTLLSETPTWAAMAPIEAPVALAATISATLACDSFDGPFGPMAKGSRAATPPAA